ncbi:YwaF family protein [Anaerofustis stercorihominis]|uniref:YwaF family protein n=1 Tax=Anaerofustis stercorihominis TaxID=214853 RepID=UPI00214B719D|nr:YwaF family protein [Anaerofustis stercorihominis]MCR2033754.1 YwaF family protein [Anaerofustis stercorihominis]
MDFLSIQNTSSAFSRFSLYHLIPLGICILMCGILYLRRRQIRRNGRGRWYFLFLGFLAFLFEVIYIVWNYAIVGDDNIIYAVPFDFTFAAMILSVLLYATRKQIFFDLLYFISFFSVINLIFADFGGYGINHFRYYQFFICNIFVVFSAMYFTFIEYKNIKNIKSLFNYGVFIVLLIAFNALISFISGFDYIDTMFSYIPSLITSAAGGVLGIVILIAVSIILALVTYLPWMIYNKTTEEKYSLHKDEKIEKKAEI